MATIRTAIELQDNFTSILYGVINSVNLGLAAMEDMQQTMNNPVDTTSMETAREQINQATIAVQELDAAMQNIESPSVGSPTAPVNSAPVQIPVEPIVPDPLVAQPAPVELPVEPELPNEPVQIPVVWQSDNLDVFTGSGIERFQQEVQSTNTMLEQLSSTQDAIARQAYNTSIFPPNMFQDLNSMAVRVDNVRSRIAAIENNPLNMGTDVANAELEQLRGQLNQAIQEQQELNRAIDQMDVSAANEAYLRLSNTVGNTERYIRDNVSEQGRFNREIREGVDEAANLQNMIAKAASAFLGVAGVRKAIGYISDATSAYNTQLNAELQLMTVLGNMLDQDYASQFEVDVTADTSNAINEIAAIQGSVEDITVNVSASTLALENAFDNVKDKASDIQSRGIYGDEAMIAGAAELSTYFTDVEALTSMMDTLSNYAMGMSGGGEIDSKAMVDYATSLGKIMSGAYDGMTKKGFEFTDAQKAIIEGTATEAQIVAVLGAEYLSMSSDMQAAAAITSVIDESWAGLYETMSNTPEGRIIQLKNAWGDVSEVIGSQLYPYVMLFVDAIESNWGTIEGIVYGFSETLQFVLGILATLVEGAFNVYQVIADNWSLISPIIYGVAAALAVYGVYLAITKGLELAGAAVKIAMCVASYAHAAATGTEASATAAATAAQYGLNTAFLSCPLVWIILLVIALIAVIFAVSNKIAEMTGAAESGFGVICGGVNVVIQFFKNLGLSIANIALGIGNAIAALGSNIMTAFHNAICSVQAWWYDLLSTVLTVVAGICESLNKLPFVEFDYSGITNAADDYAAKSAEAAGNKREYTSISDAFDKGMSTFDTFQDGWASDAFDAGAAWGDGIADKVSNFSLSDIFGSTDIPNVDGYTSALNGSGVAGNLDNISGNTKNISDAMDITEEDLKYLRDIAEQETINRYTTAEIHIDQSGMQNTVNNNGDLDGFITGLTDATNEAVDVITEGVHE